MKAPRPPPPDVKLIDGIVEALQARDRSTTENELLSKLTSQSDVDLNAPGQTFYQGCKDQDQGTFTKNYVRYLTNVRHRAAGIGATPQEAAFLLWRFPGANGFLMPQALEVEEFTDESGATRTRAVGIKGLEPGLRFNPDCSMD